MALHENPPHRSLHREVKLHEPAPGQPISQSHQLQPPSMAVASLSFPRQQYSPPYTPSQNPTNSATNVETNPRPFRRARTPVGSGSGSTASSATSSPHSGDHASSSPSTSAHPHRFDMKRMLSKPAASSPGPGASGMRPLDSPTPQRLSRPRTAPNSSPPSSPERARFPNEFVGGSRPSLEHRRRTSSSSQTYASNDARTVWSKPTSSTSPIQFPQTDAPFTSSASAGQLASLPIGRTRRTHSFSDSSADAPQTSHRPYGTGDRESRARHGAQPANPVAILPTRDIGGGSTRLYHNDDEKRSRIQLASIIPHEPPSSYPTTDSHPIADPTESRPHPTEGSASSTPITPSALIANEQRRAQLDLEAYEKQIEMFRGKTKPKPQPSTSNQVYSQQAHAEVHVQIPISLSAAGQSRTVDSRVRALSNSARSVRPIRDTTSSDAQWLSSVDYVPAGPREYLGASGAVVPLGSESIAPGITDNRSLARHATAPPIVNRDHPPLRHRAATAGAESASSAKSTLSTPVKSISNTGSVLDRASSSNHGHAGNPVGGAGVDGWRPPSEWEREPAFASSSSSSLGVGSNARIGGSSASLNMSRENSVGSAEANGPAPVLARKVSRKLSKRPRRLDLESAAEDGNVLGIADGRTGPMSTAGSVLGPNPKVNYGAGTNDSPATSGGWVEREFMHGYQIVYESPLSSAQIVQQNPSSLAPIPSGGSDGSTPRSAGSGSVSSGNKFVRLMRKLSSPSMKNPSAASGSNTPRRLPSNLANIPPVPALPESASLAASLNTPIIRDRDGRSGHIRRTSSSTDFGVLISSSLSSNKSSFANRGASNGYQYDPSTTPDSKASTAGGSGVFSKVFRRRGSASSRSQTSSSRHETDTATTSSSQRSGWSRPSTSSSHVGPDEYPDAYPSPVPPLPDLPSSNFTSSLGRKPHHATNYSMSASPAPTSGANIAASLQPFVSAPTSSSPLLTASSRAPKAAFDVFAEEDDIPPHMPAFDRDDSSSLDARDTRRTGQTSRSASRDPPHREALNRDQSRSTNTIHANLSSTPSAASTSTSTPSHSAATFILEPRLSSSQITHTVTTQKSSGSLRKRLGSFTSTKASKDKEKEGHTSSFSSNKSGKDSLRRPRTAGDPNYVGTSSHPPYTSGFATSGRSSSSRKGGSAHSHSHRSSAKEKRWSLDARSGNGEQAVAVASFAELSLSATPKKSASEKDRMWDELMRRSDRAPGGTLHASVEGTLALASDDLDGNVL